MIGLIESYHLKKIAHTCIISSVIITETVFPQVHEHTSVAEQIIFVVLHLCISRPYFLQERLLRFARCSSNKFIGQLESASNSRTI
jgi:hypothetical protein